MPVDLLGHAGGLAGLLHELGRLRGDLLQLLHAVSRRGDCSRAGWTSWICSIWADFVTTTSVTSLRSRPARAQASAMIPSTRFVLSAIFVMSTTVSECSASIRFATRRSIGEFSL